MHGRPDIEINTAQGRPLAVVEVKNFPRLSLENAVELRDGLIAQLQGPVRYAMVLSQEKGFIWRRQSDQLEYGEPEELDMRPVLREYLSDGELSQRVRGAELELILSHWLGDLARGRQISLAGVAQEGPFVRFAADIRNAQINLQALT
jgi:hypothetical protein